MANKKSKRKQVHVKTPFSSSKHPPPQPPAAHSEVGLHISRPVDAASDPVASIDAPTKTCRHLEKGIDIDKLSSEVSKPKFSISHCQLCAKESKSGSGRKGKSRSNRKKESAATADSAAPLQKKWVCLACGHVACGVYPDSYMKHKEQEGSVQNEQDSVVAITAHVSKHALCARHPLALQTMDDIVWCFVCNRAVDRRGSMSSVDGNVHPLSSKSSLQVALNVVHGKLVKENGFLKDPGKEGSRGGSVKCHVNDTREPIAVGASPLISVHANGYRRKRIVKGLMNLGNTCFFNSVMQNLLALDMLREYFSQELPGIEGPLTSSLRKLYLETNFDDGSQLSTGVSEPSGYESGLKKGAKGRAALEMIGGAYNPRSLFGAICAKAPRFRGFQQQDSHELLRCLLDGLTLEERSARAKSACISDVRKDITAPIANGSSIENGESISPETLGGETECRSSESINLSPHTAITLVENFFGGQLCSTVRCCECGHSSVVFEPMLDLSLQIPNPKKGQTSVNHFKLSSSGGGSQQKTGKNIKVLPTTGSPKIAFAAGPAAGDLSTSLQGGQSAEMDLTSVSSPADASSSNHATIVNSSSDDFGWLDFISGGMQSAESSAQGPHDAPNSLEVSEGKLVVDVRDNSAGNFGNVASVSSTVNVDIEVSKDGSEGCAKKHKNRPSVEESVAETSLSSKAEDIESAKGFSEGEDGPLLVASGVVLLPYEPLDLSNNTNGESSEALVKRAPNCSLEDISGSATELEGGFLDGFSQLFEEEESYFAGSENMIPTCSNEENSQVIVEGAWDDGNCEVEAAVYSRGEFAAVSQSSTDLEDLFLPMSLEGCLADFTRPELLSGENAWECESCTRRMKEEVVPLKSGEKVENHVFIEGTIVVEEVKEPASVLLKEFDHRVGGVENGVPEQPLPEGCEGTPGDSNGSIKGRSSPLVVDHMISGYQNGDAHLTESNDGQHLVNQYLASQADAAVDMTTLGHRLIVSNLAEPSNQGQNGHSSVQGNGGNTSLNLAASNLLIERAQAQKGCSVLDSARSTDKETSVTVQNKSTKEAKGKSKSKQTPEKLVKKDAIKKLSISKAPPILTVHLKRFAQDLRGRLSKLSGHVSFPEILDLRPFLDPRCQDSRSCFYQLVGVVEHGGTMRGGHYIAYVRSAGFGEEVRDGVEQEIKDAWYCVSDSSVRKASLQAVLNSEAYLLFYEKCNVSRENDNT